MPMPRVRLRDLMIAVAVVAALLGGGSEYRRLKRLSDRYEWLAWSYGTNLEMRLRDLAQLKSILKQLEQSPAVDPFQLDYHRLELEWLRSNIAATANIVQMYEHAASHPWEAPPRITEATDDVEGAPIPRHFLTNPPRPEPYRPPGT